MKNLKKLITKILSLIPTGIPCLLIVVLLFVGLGSQMGVSQMFKTIMNTAHDLLLNTVFFLMAVCVVTGAIGRIFMDFGVVKLLEKLLRPLMKPLFNLPGVASLGAVMTFLSDNPAIISLSQDKRFCSYFKKYQYISLTNFDVIADVAAEEGYIKPEDVKKLIAFRNNPSDESWIGA